VDRDAPLDRFEILAKSRITIITGEATVTEEVIPAAITA
jgi:hypothetical protein